MPLSTLYKPILFLLLFTNVCRAQYFAPKEKYLIDSLELGKLANWDRKLIDSCLRIYHLATADTTKVQIIDHLISSCNDDLIWPRYNKWLFNFLQKKLQHRHHPLVTIRFKMFYAAAISNMGIDSENKGDIPQALDYYHQALKIRKSIADKQGIADSYNNIALIYDNQRDIGLAMEYNLKSLKLREEIGDPASIGNSLVNLSGLCYYKKRYLTALDYAKRALKLLDESGDKFGCATAHNNLSGIYYSLAKENLEKNRKKEADSLIERAFFHTHQTFQIRQEISDRAGISRVYQNFGRLQLLRKNYEEAKRNAKLGLQIAREIGYPELIEINAGLLSEVSALKGEWKEAYEMRNLEIENKKLTENEQAIRATAAQHAKYEFEKQKAIQLSEQAKKDAINRSEKRQQQRIIYIAITGIFVLIIFLYVLYRRFKTIQEQKQVIEWQKKLVDEKQKEILDSIHYAQRIQKAILPSMQAMQNALKNGFVLYKPKDVVAGDFYWMEEYNNKVYFAAADCTGHGVPGAMVSVVCSNALSKVLLEERIENPAKILDRARELVIEQLAKSGEQMNDGMDISLCSLSLDLMTLEWAGANNPLWIIRDNTNMVEEWKADKQPVGLSLRPKPFTLNQIKLKRGDIIYLVTDGFQDQFGGKNGKKLKASGLKKLLLEVSCLPLNEQKKQIEKYFDNWKQEHEQIDDVCIVAVKI